MLLTTAPPWVITVSCPTAELTKSLETLAAENPLHTIIQLEAGGLQTKRSFIQELKKAGNFPSYCGDSLDSVDECLSDLYEFQKVEPKAIVIVLKNSEGFLINGDGASHNVIRMFSAIGKEYSKPIQLDEVWDRPAIPFHCIYHTETRPNASPFDYLPEFTLADLFR